MWKKRLLVQTAVCTVILCGYFTIQLVGSPELQNKRANAIAMISRHYTVDELADKGKMAVMSIIKSPVVVTSRILESSETRKYGVPMDEVSSGETGPVYATAGGKVVETGENEELGLYIKISHDDEISVYGNCYRLYAEENEHVRKGQVIASFTNDGTKELIYMICNEDML